MRFHLDGQPLQRGDAEALLAVWKMMVERAFGNAGLGQDLADAGAVIAAPLEQRDRRSDQAVAGHEVPFGGRR